MGCRVGMTTDVAERVVQLMRERIVPRNAKFETLKSDLTYKEASDLEISERRKHGCDGYGGGRYKPGPVWHVYRIEW